MPKMRKKVKKLRTKSKSEIKKKKGLKKNFKRKKRIKKCLEGNKRIKLNWWINLKSETSDFFYLVTKVFNLV